MKWRGFHSLNLSPQHISLQSVLIWTPSPLDIFGGFPTQSFPQILAAYAVAALIVIDTYIYEETKRKYLSSGAKKLN
jgi:hypothetical protein